MLIDQKISLETPLQYIKGIGPERSKTLSRIGLDSIADAFYYFPRRHENRAPVKKVSELVLGEKECVSGTLQSKSLFRTRYGQTIFRMTLVDDAKKTVLATWFNMPYLQKAFEGHPRVLLYGRVEKSGRAPMMVHPEYEILSQEAGTAPVHAGRITPVYPLTETLTQKTIRLLLYQLTLKLATLFRDPLPAALKTKLNLMDIRRAFRQIHFPDSEAEHKSAYKRLVFDEFFFMQLLIRVKRAEMQKESAAISHKSGAEEVARLVGSLEFELTKGQLKAIAEVVSDMKKNVAMNRLVQGDVGSGKTVVAAAALLLTAANGFQGALMAPTEALAQQHFFNLMRLLEPLGYKVGYLAQEPDPAERARVLLGLASGTIHVVVGTHALIQKDVRFKNLGLAVVDEQHKFGVFQRAALKEKAKGPVHFLLMTATPIPRTLALTLYGDLDISTIGELPKGRKSIRTLWVNEVRRSEVYSFIETALGKGQQAYVVCPLVQDKNARQAKSAETTAKEMAAAFSGRNIGVLHGKMKSDVKKKTLDDFKRNQLHILVSTVVIEVGIDVPNATVMVVENADLFGLAQLHQLRGRVGRGTEEAFCFLFSETADPDAIERLSAFESTSSGFDIAEKDLTLRGAGDILGDRQHGLPALRIGDPGKDLVILEEAGREAAAILARDPLLTLPEHGLMRTELTSRFGVNHRRAALT